MAYTPPGISSIDFSMGGGYTAPSISSLDFEMKETEGAIVDDTVAGTPVVGALTVIMTYGVVTPIDTLAGSPDIGSLTATSIGAPMDDTVSGAPDIGAVTAAILSASMDDTLSGVPVVDSLVASLTYGVAKINDTISGVPDIPDVVASIYSAVLNDVVAGAPSIPAIVAFDNSSKPEDVIAGIPTIDSLIVTFAGTGHPVGVVAGSPVVDTVTASIVAAEIPDCIAGYPVVDTLIASFVPFRAEYSKLIYLCTLTGSPDIEIPISSFQCRLRSGDSSYLSVVIPRLDQAKNINDRADGQLVIEAAYLVGSEVRVRSEIARAKLEDIKIYRGTINQSIVLVGYRQETYTPKTVTLRNSVYSSIINGEYRYRFAEPNLDLNPGDTVTIGLDTFVANVISYFVTAGTGRISTQMEVSES